MKAIPISALPPYMQAQAKAKAAYATAPKTFTAKPLNESHGLFKAEDLGKAKKKVRPTLTPDCVPTLVRSVTVSPDGNTVEIVLNASPSSLSTAQQKGAMPFIGKDGKAHTRFYTKAKIKNAEKALRLALEPYAHHVRGWGVVPVELTLLYYFPFTSGTPKKDIHMYAPHLERPDCENIGKGLIDAITAAGFWEDDSKINNLISKKRRSKKTPHIVIKFKNMQPLFEELYRQELGGEEQSLFNQPTTTPHTNNEHA